MQGLHLIADLHHCRGLSAPLAAAELEARCVDACVRHRLTVVGRLFHTFRDERGEPAGVTGAVVLAESHLAVHTWPELSAVTLDVYVCNYSSDNSGCAEALFEEIIASFLPDRVERRRVERGRLEPV